MSTESLAASTASEASEASEALAALELYASIKPTFKNLSICRYARNARESAASGSATFITRVLIPFECSLVNFDDSEPESPDAQSQDLVPDSDDSDDSDSDQDVSDDAGSAFSD